MVLNAYNSLSYSMKGQIDKYYAHLSPRLYTIFYNFNRTLGQGLLFERVYTKL